MDFTSSFSTLFDKKSKNVNFGSSPSSALAFEVHDELTDLIYQTVRSGCKTPMGAHVETFLSSLGSLAGFGCQMALRDGLIKPGLKKEKDLFTTVEGDDGGKYYFGTSLNRLLIEDRNSVFAIITGGIYRNGYSEYPNVFAISKRVSQNIGGPDFGTINVPQSHQPLLRPITSLRKFWPLLYPQISRHYASLKRATLDPLSLGSLFAEVIQLLMVETKNIIPPPLSGQIAFEAAMAMASVDPAALAAQANQA